MTTLASLRVNGQITAAGYSPAPLTIEGIIFTRLAAMKIITMPNALMSTGSSRAVRKLSNPTYSATSSPFQR